MDDARPDRWGEKVIRFIAGLPRRPPKGLTPQRFLELMGHDKKVQAGKLRLVLLRALGEAVVTAEFDPASLQQTLEQFCS